MRAEKEIVQELEVSAWLNTPSPISLADNLGKVIVIEAFQMLCPGCVSHALPQAQHIAKHFSPEDVLVLGLHSVFEHHDAQGRLEVLEAFLYENRISFPVAMDAPSDDSPVPRTMRNFGLSGTPSLILIDRYGAQREQYFGVVEDLVLGARIMKLMVE